MGLCFMGLCPKPRHLLKKVDENFYGFGFT